MLPNMFNALAKGWRIADGSPVDRDLNELLYGQEITRVETGAQTEEGISIARMFFESTDQMLIVPMQVRPDIALETGVKLVTGFVFKKGKTGKIWIPGQN